MAYSRTLLSGTKFLDEKLRNEIRYLLSPMEAANVGRNRNNPLRKDWETVKDDIMRVAVMEKFKQNAKAKDLLLSTGNSLLIEHTRNDNYWADGGDGKGKNMLGMILMETREILR